MELELNITYFKILKTIDLLNKENAFPNLLGLKKILKGEVDEETSKFKDILTFSTLISIGNRQLASNVKMLIRYNYLRNIYDEESNDYFLKITIKGENMIESYEAHHKINYKKTTKKFKKTILIK